MALCGGANPSSITPEAVQAADLVQAEARRRYLGIPPDVMAKVTNFDAWEVVEVLTQVVAGTNYFVKVRISASGGDMPPTEYVQLKIFKPLPHTGGQPELLGMKRDEEAGGDLTAF